MITEQAWTVTLETLTPLHIGGQDNPLTGMENAVARVGGALVIPGPSLKGALRHQIETYLVGQFYDAHNRCWPQKHAALQPCMAGAGPVSPEEQRLVAAGRYRRTGRDNRFSGCAYRSDRDSPICPVCYLLGAQGLVGFVQVPFLTAQGDPSALYSGRIDRAKGTIADRTNRPYELVRGGVQFTGTLRVLKSDDLRDWQLGAPRRLGGDTPDAWLDRGEWDSERIIKGLVHARLEAIQVIGGYRSKGFGRVKVTVTEA